MKNFMCSKLQNFYRKRSFIYWINFFTSKRKRRSGSCADMCVAKLLAFAVIASIVIVTVTAAPLVTTEDNSVTATTKRPRKHNVRRKNLERGGTDFSDDDKKEWWNSCHSIDYKSTTENPSKPNYNQSYNNIKLSVQRLNTSFVTMTKINTSDIETWEKFNDHHYKWLPTKPGGLVHRWHEDIQVYLAAFIHLYKTQHFIDTTNNNNTISTELKELRDSARDILCDIEHFLNATSNEKNKLGPYWLEKEEMAKKITLQKKKATLNNLFVKARFEQYIDKMYRRIKNFNLDRNLEVKTFKKPGHRRRPTSTKRSRKQHKGNKHKGANKGRRIRTTTEYAGEAASSPKMFIITTTRRTRRGTRTTKVSGSHLAQ